jgi:4-diphosphocytidyl-2-C-methyl-D-erythritol kinase
MEIEAFAKVNLSLRVRGREASGLHPVASLVQSIDWSDRIILEDAEEDAFSVVGVTVPDDETNLAFRSLTLLRTVVERSRPARLELTKRIPVAAGLGGGSADAAAVLAVAAERCRLDPRARNALAPQLGADVAFCLRGGTARMEGFGEEITPVPPPGGYWLGVVVPPFELATAEVYRRWDDLDGPSGPALEAGDVPDSLREFAPLANDLYPAAVAESPELGDWAADLRERWGIPVAMSGSGPALFGFFGTEVEATEAVRATGGTRAARACRPVERGWRVVRE